LRDPSLPEGAVAVAEHQSAGRGRAGRSWFDAPGQSLLVSVLLRPVVPVERLPSLSLVAGLATAEAIETTAGVRCLLKWPNDVVHGDGKLAGILLEVVDGAVVCGIGVNVNQDVRSLPAGSWGDAVSLRTATRRRHDRAGLLVEMLRRLEERYGTWADAGLEGLGDALGERDWLRGRRVRVAAGTGVADGIAPDGRLGVLLDGAGRVLVGSGEVVPV
jgi:BirA family biotin operon repressor/biotin-[acetyl-CoA-carboxylase] ligase